MVHVRETECRHEIRARLPVPGQHVPGHQYQGQCHSEQTGAQRARSGGQSVPADQGDDGADPFRERQPDVEHHDLGAEDQDHQARQQNTGTAWAENLADQHGGDELAQRCPGKAQGIDLQMPPQRAQRRLVPPVFSVGTNG